VDAVLRVAAVYFTLLLVFRLAGARTLAQTTPFDLVLLLVISETTQQALIGDDSSFTNAATLIVTFVAIDVALSLVKQRSRKFAAILEGSPLVLLSHGKPHKEPMDKSRIDEEDILEAARQHHGLTTLDEIEYAVLERHGKISIIPKRPPAGA
jgi:uncharacterized membrane protein YcaP (DUF421 family)